LKAHGFSVLSIKKEKPTLAVAAQQINNGLRSGISHSLAPELPSWFCDEIQEDPEAKAKRNNVRPSMRTRRAAAGPRETCGLFSLAFVELPYVKWRNFVDPYLYCLARKLD
jgi:hypothetical protein